MSIVIRVADKSDANSIGELHAASWRSAYRGALSDSYLSGDIVTERQNFWKDRFQNPVSQRYTWVAEKDSNVVGFACVYLNEHEQLGSFLNNIHVMTSLHGQGVGRTLLRKVNDCCTNQNGSDGLFLWVLESNVKAQGFYLRFGATNIGSDVWNAPDGTKPTMYLFSWKHSADLHSRLNL
jgi:ribosomal protein S18 acetylase RimI-like enzyme